LKVLITINTQNLDKRDIEHAMVAILNTYGIDLQLNKKLASNLIVLRVDIQEHPDATALPALEFLGIKILRTFKEAISDPKYGLEWKSEVDEEIKALVQNGIWEEYIQLMNSNLVSIKWVFITKMKDSQIERFKVRLVLQEFSHGLGKDYNATFAPTVYLDILHLYLLIVIKEDLKCSHFDFQNAFTELHLKKEIYLVVT
jgi:hypothetical protein